MTKSQNASLAKDFSEISAFLAERAIIPKTPPADLSLVARGIHECTYSPILWKFRLTGLPKRGSLYLEEIASDALQILPQVMLGYSKTAKLLTRGIIENTLRHIYFSDHPIEFIRINSVGKWHPTISSLFEYATGYPDFVSTEPEFDAVARLSSIYSELSAGVHGRSVRELETRAALRSIVYDPARAKEDALFLRRCTEAVNFLMSIFHHNSFASFAKADRSLILRTMPAAARRIWKNHEPSEEVATHGK